MKNIIKLSLLAITSIFVMSMFSGCAMHTAIKKRNLDVQTKMSNSVFLEPVAPEEQIVYVRVRNTTDKDINVESDVKKAFEQHGFKVTRNPKEAQFMVQANLLQVGKSDARTAKSALSSGFGGALVGAGIAGATGASGGGYAAGAAAGGLIGIIADALVDDVYFTMITDVEIRQRAADGETIDQTANANAKQGMSANVNQKIKTANAQWKIFRTRIVSTANKVNLEFTEAKPVLINGLTRSLSGVL